MERLASGAVPADLLLLVGVLGNLAAEDLTRIADAVGALATAGGTVVWTHGGGPDGRSAVVRRELARAGGVETSYRWLDHGDRPTVGVVRLGADPHPFVPGERFFTMLR
ncbi:hypothetical protein [Lapillicoccus jejuensis]|uniref:S-adenosyl methyltransferase n=1 Tax=Lapillicoccus jejuensis TaxID=402171 RepID=A0A542DZE5_9MICO|nr:hypothetical protein [Lapillicoccus jejuensis]TQJ08462.1 hypothetical protein FB458_1552 [Lapillicoccus jejuensis]